MKIKYKKGCPLPSHEYLKNVFGDGYDTIDQRGFMVGCHGANISTVFDHPWKGDIIDSSILEDFGLENVEKLTIPFSINSIIFHHLPYGVKRKLRYWSEKQWILRPVFSSIYNILRS